MYTLLTKQGDGSYDLPRVGAPIRGNKGYTDSVTGTQYSKDIFLLWDAAKLIDIGLAEYQEVNYDRANYRSSDTTDSYDGGIVKTTHTIALKDIAPLKTDKMSELKSHRSSVETGGVVFVFDASNTYSISSTHKSQNKLANAYGSIGTDDRKWTVTNSDFANVRVTFTAAKFKTLADAVVAHVDACYEAEDIHISTIDALTNAQDVFDYDVTSDVSTAWPVNPAREI